MQAYRKAADRQGLIVFAGAQINTRKAVYLLMKLWQFRFDILRQNVQRPLLCNDEFEEYLPKSSGENNPVIYGDIEGTHIGIECMGRCVAGIYCCIDVRCPDAEIIEVICDFACDNGCVVMSKGRIYNPDPDVLSKLIEVSEARRFVKNPPMYLERFIKI